MKMDCHTDTGNRYPGAFFLAAEIKKLIPWKIKPNKEDQKNGLRTDKGSAGKLSVDSERHSRHHYTIIMWIYEYI